MSDFSTWDILRNLLLAARWTVVLSIVSFIGGGLLGIVLLFMRIGKFKAARIFARYYVELFQGTPLLMQLFLAFFGLGLFGINVPAWLAAGLALIFWSAAFLMEIWRGCVDAIAKGQWEASASLGMGYLQQMRYVILPQAILDIPELGCLNLHASLLPRWRGAAPIQRAVMAGDAESGVCVMKMEAGLDTGPVALTRKIAIEPDMTGGELHDALSLIGAEAMVEAMVLLEKGTLETVAQPEEGVLYAAKIDKAETRVDFSRPAKEVHDHIRGLAPFPGAWTEIEVGGKPERVKLLASHLADADGHLGASGTIIDDHLTVACGTGAVSLVRLQKAGGKPLDAKDFLRGTPLAKGTVIA